MRLPPVTPLRRFDTHRLLPAKYSANYDSVLTRVAANDTDLQAIFELDNATNQRLQAEENQRPDITARELVFHVPNYRIINAAFAHPHPFGARFSDARRGAWYAAFELRTSQAEVLFHKEVEYAEIGWTEREEVQYDDYLADFSAPFHDLRRDPRPDPRPQLPPDALSATEEAEEAEQFAACLDPESYVVSQQLAAELLVLGSLGIVYPSVRRAGGTCLACFRPSVVSNVRKGTRYTLIWTPRRAQFRKEGL
jgi:RES domain